MYFRTKNTDYGAYRELLIEGRKILGWIEQRPNGYFYYAYGKPSQYSFISFECDTLEQARKEIVENLK